MTEKPLCMLMVTLHRPFEVTIITIIPISQMKKLHLRTFRDWPKVTQMQAAELGYQSSSASLRGHCSHPALHLTLWDW